MSTGDARCSQLTIALSFGRKQAESSSHHSYERPQEEIEDLNPDIIVSYVSTATKTEEKETVSNNPNFLSSFFVTEKVWN